MYFLCCWCKRLSATVTISLPHLYCSMSSLSFTCTWCHSEAFRHKAWRLHWDEVGTWVTARRKCTYRVTWWDKVQTAGDKSRCSGWSRCPTSITICPPYTSALDLFLSLWVQSLGLRKTTSPRLRVRTNIEMKS